MVLDLNGGSDFDKSIQILGRTSALLVLAGDGLHTPAVSCAPGMLHSLD